MYPIAAVNADFYKTSVVRQLSSLPVPTQDNTLLQLQVDDVFVAFDKDTSLASAFVGCTIQNRIVICDLENHFSSVHTQCYHEGWFTFQHTLHFTFQHTLYFIHFTFTLYVLTQFTFQHHKLFISEDLYVSTPVLKCKGMLKCTVLKCKVCWNVNHPLSTYTYSKSKQT